MKLLEQIRAWENKIFTDWIWDISVGGVLAVLSLVLGINVLIAPFIITAINQLYNRLFELKDFALRMTIPILIYLIQLWL